MLEQQTRPPRPDRATRTAALWATAIALPVTVVAAFLIFAFVRDADPGAASGADAPTTSAPAAVPSAPVAMAAPPLSPRGETVCRALLARLPRAIRELPQRQVTAGPEQNAAYGEPPLTVACGVPVPPTTLSSVLVEMNGVCWYPEQRDQETLFTTMDREVPVRVTVPGAYAQSAQWANEFSDTVVAAVPSASGPGVPTACA